MHICESVCSRSLRWLAQSVSFLSVSTFLIISLPSLRQSSIRGLLGGETTGVYRGRSWSQDKTKEAFSTVEPPPISFNRLWLSISFCHCLGGDSVPLSASLPASHSLSGLLIYCSMCVWVLMCLSISAGISADVHARAARTVYVYACAYSIYMNSNRF